MSSRDIIMSTLIDKMNNKGSEVEKQKDKKLELLKRFKEKSKEVKIESSNIEKTKEIFINTKHDKNKEKELENKIKKLEQKVLDLRNKLQDSQVKSSQQKDKIYSANLQIAELLQTIVEKDSAISNLKNDKIGLNKQINELLVYKHDVNMKVLKQENSTLKSKVLQLTKYNNSLIEANKSINNQILTFEALGKIDDNFSYKGKYNKIKQEYTDFRKNLNTQSKEKFIKLNENVYRLGLTNKALKKTIIDMIKYTRYSKIMTFLEYYISINWQQNWISSNEKVIDNHYEREIDEVIVYDYIQEEYQSIDKIVESVDNYKENEIEEIKIVKLKEEIDDKVKTTNEIENVQYGYLKMISDSLYFISVNDEEYELDEQSNEDLIDDMPCKVKINEDKAIILKTYMKDELDIISNYNSKNDKVTIKDSKYEKLTEYYREKLKGFTVLIVGSRFKTKYVSILTMCNVNILWFDPFEESYKLLGNRFKCSDVVILCADHISHEVLNLINVNDEKVQIMYNDTITRILSRINYALDVMGKI